MQKWSEWLKPERVLIDKKEATMRSFLLISDRKSRCWEWSGCNDALYAKKFVLMESSVRAWKNAYTRVFEPAHACGKSWSHPGIVGRAVLERPFTKIRPRNLWRLPFREIWTPWKFPATYTQCKNKSLTQSFLRFGNLRYWRHYVSIVRLGSHIVLLA